MEVIHTLNISMHFHVRFLLMTTVMPTTTLVMYRIIQLKMLLHISILSTHLINLPYS